MTFVLKTSVRKKDPPHVWPQNGSILASMYEASQTGNPGGGGGGGWVQQQHLSLSLSLSLSLCEKPVSQCRWGALEIESNSYEVAGVISWGGCWGDLLGRLLG